MNTINNHPNQLPNYIFLKFLDSTDQPTNRLNACMGPVSYPTQSNPVYLSNQEIEPKKKVIQYRAVEIQIDSIPFHFNSDQGARK